MKEIMKLCQSLIKKKEKEEEENFGKCSSYISSSAFNFEIFPKIMILAVHKNYLTPPPPPHLEKSKENFFTFLW